ncbi:hypothetical protein AOQ89_02375 [bacterium endosymbiont of Pedicinus badii]|nr:hypothetical protein AOQ89_02375 [bacterium endosymbiont of Pedicinus badii]
MSIYKKFYLFLENTSACFISFFSSFLVAYFFINILLKILKKLSFLYFIFYRFAICILVYYVDDFF